jgi:hypothetical protein
MTKEQILDITWLKKNSKMIHFFGLGFIQIKLNDEYRVHVYTDKLSATVTKEDIHNHRYGFESTIIKGKLQQQFFTVVPAVGGNFLLVEESCNPDNKIDSIASEVNVEFAGEATYSAGDMYALHHSSFHRVYSIDAITLLKRGNIEKSLAEVVYRKGEPPQCPFSVKVSEAALWEIVEEALK